MDAPLLGRGPGPEHGLAREVDHRVDALQLVGLDDARRGIPQNLVLGHGAGADEAPDGVPAGREEGDELRADQAGRPADRNGERSPLCVVAPVQGEVAARDAVAVGKLTAQLRLHQNRPGGRPEPPGRQRVLDPVDEPTASLLGRLEAVGVVPVRKRSLHLPVAELPSLDHVVVLGHPSERQRPGAQSQNGAVALSDAVDPLQPHRRPRRHEPLERPRPGVPVEYRLGGGVERSREFEGVHRR